MEIPNKEKIKYFLKENRWIIAALIFFIAWKFILITLLWNDRLSPPEPDDSFTYINQITAVKNCPRILCNYPSATFTNSGGFIYLSYRIFFGIIAKLFFLSPLQTYHFGFYFGTVLIPLALLFFLSKITKEKKAIAFLLFILAFYHGMGETHGFFWVTPSFYSVLLFFLILAIILAPKKHFILLLFLVPVFIFTHPLSIYFSFIFPLFYLFLLIFKKRNDFLILKKIVLVFFIALLCHTSVSLYLKEQRGTNYFSIENQINQIKRLQKRFFLKKNIITNISAEQSIKALNISEPDDNLPNKDFFINKKMNILSATYFKWFFPIWVGFIPFIFFLIILFYYRQYALLSLYFSSLIFFLISTFISEFGYRSGIILWIASFLLYGFGFFYSFRFIKDKIKNRYLLFIMQIALSLGLFIFIFLNATYSLIYTKNLNIRNDYNIRSEFSDYITAHIKENDLINMDSTLLSYDGISVKFDRSQRTQDLESAKYIVVLQGLNDAEKTKNSKINIFFTKIMNFLKIRKEEKREAKTVIPENYSEEKRFGSIIIYRNNLIN